MNGQMQDRSKNVLEIANELTGGDRQKDYGHPRDNFQKIADLWAGYKGLNYKYTPEDVAMMMILVKVARQKNKPKNDNLIDIAGYARTAEMINE